MSDPCTPGFENVALTSAAILEALGSAVNGDVICLVAGTSSPWTTQIDIGSFGIGVEIRGAGDLVAIGSAGETIIHIGNMGGGAVFGSNGGSATHPSIINNIKFTFDETSSSNIHSIISWNSQTDKPWIIHHNDFEFTNIPSGNYPKTMNIGAKGGIIYRNRFSNDRFNITGNTNMIVIFHSVSDFTGDWWESAHTRGTADTTGLDNLYVETNEFFNFNVAMDMQTSSRIVWRFNDMHNSSNSGHGFDTSPTGPRHSELYNNHYFCDEIYTLNSWFSIRGGTHQIFNNRFEYIDPATCNSTVSAQEAPSINFDQHRARVGEHSAVWPGSYPDTYPLGHNIGWGWISGENQQVGETTAQNQPGLWGYPLGTEKDGLAQALEPSYIFNNDNDNPILLDITSGYTGEGRLGSWSANGKTSGTELVVTDYLNSGQQAVVVFADLVGGSAPTITDSCSGSHSSWTALTGGSTAGMRLSAWTTTMSATCRMTVTIHFDSSSAARAGGMGQIRGVTASPQDKNPAVATIAIGTSNDYVATDPGTLTQADEVVIGYFALNGPSNWAGESAPNTNDAVSATLPDHRGVTCGSCGASWTGINATTGGTDTSNVTVGLTYRAVDSNASGAQPTLHNGTAQRSGLAGVVTFKLSGLAADVLDLQITDFIRSDREYYEDAVSFDGTSGVGVLTRSAMDAITTCNAGVPVWVTDEGSWNTENSTVGLPGYQAGQGQFYVCDNADTWNLYYTPKEYPHPLATETGEGGVVEPPPVSTAHRALLTF